MLKLWTFFALSSALILIAGTQLSKYGNQIARLTGLGGTWIGMILVATVTSLPELITGISAVAFASVPDIAAGDVLGSCVFNLALIALLDTLERPASVFRHAGHGHIIGAAFGALMLALAGGAIVAGRAFDASILHVSVVTPLLLALYVFSMHTIFRQESEARAIAPGSPVGGRDLTLRQAVARYVAAAAVVVAAAVALPFIAADLAVTMGWSQGFVGTSLIAVTTSLPELTVTFAAWRMKAIDLAIGNLIGSNLFNLAILAIDDILFLPGPLPAHIAMTHAFSAFAAIGMTGTVIVALMAPPRARLLNLVSWTSALLVLLFFANSWLQFRHPLP
jgi:cation:H+ antiporter